LITPSFFSLLCALSRATPDRNRTTPLNVHDNSPPRLRFRDFPFPFFPQTFNKKQGLHAIETSRPRISSPPLWSQCSPSPPPLFLQNFLCSTYLASPCHRKGDPPRSCGVSFLPPFSRFSSFPPVKIQPLFHGLALCRHPPPAAPLSFPPWPVKFQRGFSFTFCSAGSCSPPNPTLNFYHRASVLATFFPLTALCSFSPPHSVFCFAEPEFCRGNAFYLPQNRSPSLHNLSFSIFLPSDDHRDV